MSGRSKDRQELAETAIPLTAHLPVIAARSDQDIVRRLFEPLGYTVQVQRSNLDDRFPETQRGGGVCYDLSSAGDRMPERTFVYKMIVDNNGAPCLHNDLLSLAICKPIIRKCAKKGDWVLGFAADSLAPDYPENALIYVAQVSDCVTGAKYYLDDGPYSGRPDCIYRAEPDGFRWREGALYHGQEGDLEHDLGRPEDGFDRGRILLSSKFAYFGPDGPTRPQTSDPIRSLLVALKQGHRVNLTPEQISALDRYKALATADVTAWIRKKKPAERERGHCTCDFGLATDDPRACSS